MDPNKVRPREDWILVLADERKTVTHSGLHLPVSETGVEKVTEGAGTILAVGNGEKNAKVGVEKGCRIVYRSYLKHAHKLPVDEKWESGEEKFYFLMDTDDVMAILPPGLEVGIFSGRPMSPVSQNG